MSNSWFSWIKLMFALAPLFVLQHSLCCSTASPKRKEKAGEQKPRTSRVGSCLIERTRFFSALCFKQVWRDLSACLSAVTLGECHGLTPAGSWGSPSKMWLCAASRWEAVLAAKSRSCAQYLRFAGVWLYCQLCRWESAASVKLVRMGQSPSHITYRQFYVRKCKEPPKIRRKVHLITILSPVIAKWGSLERSVRAEQACSDPSPEYSPKIQRVLAQGLPKTVAVSLDSRVIIEFSLWICPFLNINTFLQVFLC